MESIQSNSSKNFPKYGETATKHIQNWNRYGVEEILHDTVESGCQKHKASIKKLYRKIPVHKGKVIGITTACSSANPNQENTRWVISKAESKSLPNTTTSSKAMF